MSERYFCDSTTMEHTSAAQEAAEGGARVEFSLQFGRYSNMQGSGDLAIEWATGLSLLRQDFCLPVEPAEKSPPVEEVVEKVDAVGSYTDSYKKAKEERDREAHDKAWDEFSRKHSWEGDKRKLKAQKPFFLSHLKAQALKCEKENLVIENLDSTLDEYARNPGRVGCTWVAMRAKTLPPSQTQRKGFSSLLLQEYSRGPRWGQSNI